MAKTKKPRRKGMSNEQRAAQRRYRGEIGEKIKDRLTDAELTELVNSIVRACEKEHKAGEAEGVKYAFTICMLALCDKFGFGAKRLDRLWTTCRGYTDDISAGRMDFALVSQTLADEYGITIKV